MGNRTTPINSQQNTAAPGGTTIALMFDKACSGLAGGRAEENARADSRLREAHRNRTGWSSHLPPEVQAAVKEKRAIEGMDRDQVLLALGKPRTKVRETKEGSMRKTGSTASLREK